MARFRGEWTAKADSGHTLLVLAIAALRKQSRHRQSSPSTGIGNRAVSVAHQQAPPGLQENSVPQREQARRRGGSVRSFMTTL